MCHLRISIVTETFTPQVNGVSRTLDRLVQYLTQQGDRVQLIIPRYDEAAPPTPPTVEKNEWRGVALPFYKEVQLPLARPSSIRRNFEAFRPDLVHVATEGPLGWAALRAARQAGLTTVSSYHTNFSQYLSSYRAGFLEPTCWRYLRWFHNQTRATYCPTPSIRNLLTSHGFENVQIWSRGVDCRRFDPGKRDPELRPALGIAPDEVVFVYAGRLAAEKNLEMLLEAWGQIPQNPPCRLLLIGDGPLRGRLENLADERVIFAGYKHGEELARLYASADAFAFPSLTETFGNVILEGMASGLAAIGFRVPGPQDIVRDGVTGVVVEPVTAGALAAAMKELAGDRLRLRRMGGEARRYAEGQTWDNILGRLRQSYEDLSATGSLPMASCG